ncbi:hypothetical protein BV511_15620 [Methylorubrum extorquens]|uniref:hypothetical protein n=1 Tax=Methylorubrum extorquens TaxID=408 RepID=UPI000972B824|nr:hypothetical protein [Methylorubrum extorquens]APX86002.1 hypothetical protein BV511_15620 [Methylorubrum extorquens]
MPWTRRTITPHWPARDLTIVVETSRIADARDLATDPVWQSAPLTEAGRAAVLRPAGGVCGPALLRGWRVRTPGTVEHCALVLRLDDHFLHGALVSARPERVAMEYTDRMLVVTPDLVVGVRGADEGSAFGHVGDILVGTYRRRTRRRRVEAEDLDALAALAPG